jgi:predicted membrane protein
VLAASHLRRTFNTLAQKSGEASFTTAGILLWWGAILTIILVGLVLIVIAWIFATIGFFTMKAQQQQPYTPPSTQPEHGTVIESKGMNNNKYAQSETMGRRGI